MYITKEIQKIYIQWFNVTRWIYNKCVEYEKKKIGKILLSNLRHYTIHSTTIHDPEIMAELAKVPYEVKDSVVRDFMKAFTTSIKMVKDGTLKRFDMKYRSKRDIQSFSIYNRYIKMTRGGLSCFPRFIPSGSLHCREEIGKIHHDTRLTWDGKNTFTLHVPIDTVINPNFIQKHTTCSIDPGEKVFVSVYGSDGNSYLIGDGGSKKVDKLAMIAQRMRNGIPRIGKDNPVGKFIKSSKRKTRQHLATKAKDLERRARALVKDIHYKTTKFLTDNYDVIIIPKFNTIDMCRRNDASGKYKRKISRDVSRRLIKWFHYSFRELLRAKGGSRIVVGTEEWTSKTCGNCFNINTKLGSSRIFHCPNAQCGLIGHRDLLAARNIMIRNWKLANLNFR